MADDLTISATISRTSGGNLVIDSDGIYRVVSFGPGARSWRRDRATSPSVAGGQLVNAVLDVQVRPLVVRVYGATAAELNTRTGALVDALSQFSYTLTVTIDGTTWAYACEPADGGPVNGELDKFELLSRQQTYAFQIPGSPIPTTGVM